MLITKLIIEMRMASMTKSLKIPSDGRVGLKLNNETEARKDHKENTSTFSHSLGMYPLQ